MDSDCYTMRAHALLNAIRSTYPGKTLPMSPEPPFLDTPRSNLRHARASDRGICQEDTTEANGPPERSESAAITTTFYCRTMTGLGRIV